MAVLGIGEQKVNKIQGKSSCCKASQHSTVTWAATGSNRGSTDVKASSTSIKGSNRNGTMWWCNQSRKSKGNKGKGTMLRQGQ
jgi:hypothetical protein